MEKAERGTSDRQMDRPISRITISSNGPAGQRFRAAVARERLNPTLEKTQTTTLDR